MDTGGRWDARDDAEMYRFGMRDDLGQPAIDRSVVARHAQVAARAANTALTATRPQYSPSAAVAPVRYGLSQDRSLICPCASVTT